MSVKRKINYTNRYTVIDQTLLTMLIILSTNILGNLIILLLQCEFISLKQYTIWINNSNVTTTLCIFNIFFIQGTKSSLNRNSFISNTDIFTPNTYIRIVNVLSFMDKPEWVSELCSRSTSLITQPGFVHLYTTKFGRKKTFRRINRYDFFTDTPGRGNLYHPGHLSLE